MTERSRRGVLAMRPRRPAPGRPDAGRQAGTALDDMPGHCCRTTAARPSATTAAPKARSPGTGGPDDHTTWPAVGARTPHRDRRVGPRTASPLPAGASTAATPTPVPSAAAPAAAPSRPRRQLTVPAPSSPTPVVQYAARVRRLAVSTAPAAAPGRPARRGWLGGGSVVGRRPRGAWHPGRRRRRPRSPRPVRRGRGERTPRRARLQLRHFNVWTVFKFSVVLAVALFFVWMIIVAVLYGSLDQLKVIDKINKTVQTIENNSNTNDAVTPRIVFTSAFLIGLVNIVLFIVLTTIGSVVYNLCADLVGGIEVTLAERD